MRWLALLLLLTGCGGSEFEASATGGAAGSTGSGGAAGAIATGGTSGTTGTCPPNLKAAQLIRVESVAGVFCIDATEANGNQYGNFLDAANKPTPPSYCSWNTDYTPSQNWPLTNTAMPVVGVNWCQAWAFCAWAGKRLCGKIGGGPSGYDDQGQNTDEWYYACSKGGTLQYPYGASYDADACNSSDTGVGTTWKPGSQVTCEGGFKGLFDLSGNVTEWVDACDGTTGQDDHCHDRNGSYLTGPGSQICNATWKDKRSDTYPDVGIRCCADAL
jgi:formylglycine-generating enzyme required for sulfatase activity